MKNPFAEFKVVGRYFEQNKITVFGEVAFLYFSYHYLAEYSNKSFNTKLLFASLRKVWVGFI